MNLKIAICDDNQNDIKLLKDNLLTTSFQVDCDFDVSSFITAKDFLLSYKEGATYNAVFMDIELDGENGIETAKTIKTLYDRDVYIIFVSSYPQYMHESFSVHPFFYVKKPFSLEDIKNVMSDLITDIAADSTTLTLINSANTSTVIKIHKIFYIELTNSKNQELTFHLEHESITAKGTISYWANKLASHSFIMCNRKELVNPLCIHYIDEKHIILNNQERLVLSTRCKKAVKETFLNKMVTICNK